MLMALTGARPLSSGLDSRVDTLSPSPMAPRGEQPLSPDRIASTSTERHSILESNGVDGIDTRDDAAV